MNLQKLIVEINIDQVVPEFYRTYLNKVLDLKKNQKQLCKQNSQKNFFIVKNFTLNHGKPVEH